MVEAKQIDGDIQMDGFNIILATEKEIIEQRVNNTNALQFGTHQPRALVGNKLLEISSLGLSPSIVEQSIYEYLSQYDQIKTDTIIINKKYNGNETEFSISCETLNGDSFQSTLGGAN